MKARPFLIASFFSALAALSTCASAARYALVIGNDTYHHVAPLKNAREDARAIAGVLGKAGFNVRLALDQKQGEFKRTLRNFKNQLQGGDEVVFFYAGHAVQIGGTNYLLPVDLGGEDEEQVKDEAIGLQRVLDDLQDQKARFALAIVDACRDNPFKGRGRNLATRGLAPTTAVDGQMIIFSAGSGQQALDRLGENDRARNGLFTRVFMEEMVKPGVPVHQALRNVRSEVVRLAKSVGHQQTPAIYDQSTGEFYFIPGKPQAETTAPAAVPAPPPAAPPEVIAKPSPPAPAAAPTAPAATPERPVAAPTQKPPAKAPGRPPADKPLQVLPTF